MTAFRMMEKMLSVMMGDFDIDDENENGNITINGVPYCAMITDLIFEKSEEELLSMSMTKPYKKYFAIQKECYRPYFTECGILDDYNDLTEESSKILLDELGDRKCLGCIIKEARRCCFSKSRNFFCGMRTRYPQRRMANPYCLF